MAKIESQFPAGSVCSGFGKDGMSAINIRKNKMHMMTIYDIADCNDNSTADSEVIEKFLFKIGKYELLTPEETQALLELAVKGDEKAFNKVLCANLRFVVAVASQYQNKGLSLLELLKVGWQGLANAIMANTSKPQDEKFMQFAVPFMRQAIEDAIENNTQTLNNE